MLEIRLLTEDERTMLTAHSRVTHPLFCRHHDRHCDVVTLLTRLALARAVVKATRVLLAALDEVQLAMPDTRSLGTKINAAMAVLEQQIRAHDAEVGR